MTSSRVEVITSVARRRRWSVAEKERLVAATLEPGASLSDVARSAGVHASQLFRWRKSLCERVAPPPVGFLAVTVDAPVGGAGLGRSGEPRQRRRRGAGRIEIELAGGERVRVGDGVDEQTLRRVFDALKAR